MIAPSSRARLRVQVDKCPPETKCLRSHSEVDSERGLPRAAFCAINVTVYILTTLCFEQLVVDFSRVRFQLGLRESRRI